MVSFCCTIFFAAGYSYVKDEKSFKDKSFTTLISDKGAFYSIKVCRKIRSKKRYGITFYDSLKILPFRVDEIAKAFGLSFQKLEIDYKALRPVGYTPTPQELLYLKHDVQIVAQALKTLFSEGLTKITQASNAFHDFKTITGKDNFAYLFPPPDYDGDIRQSYKGGFTYVSKRFRGVDVGEGLVLDVNSLYPSVMYYRDLPYGEGKFFDGRYQPDQDYPLYIQMFRCSFKVKDGYIPTIQLKNNLSFIPTEYVEDSGDEEVTLCLTSVDLELFFEHYDVYDIEWLSGWKFRAANTLFREYIDKWVAVKNEAAISGNKGMRTLAKLMLNALYGKFATNPRMRAKIPCYDWGDEEIIYSTSEPEERKPVYIPVASFITAWARFTTITAAQSVYERFIYADTDSLHLIGVEIPEGMDIDPVRLGAWKIEKTFTRARFLRPKTYIEEVEGDLEITCAGMPESCYQYVTWENFQPGAKYPGKLLPKRVSGGVVLADTDFTIKLDKREKG